MNGQGWSRIGLRIQAGIAVLVACMIAGGAVAKAQAVPARIQAGVSNSAMTVLKGSLSPMVRAEADAGRVPANMQLTGMTLRFNLSASQQADLAALLAAQQNPQSAQYHQWLTPEQFGARFGMAQVDLDQVELWLQQQGFRVDSVNRSRTAILFSGTAGQVEAAFQTQMHYYNGVGRKDFAPSTALSLPSAIAPTVAAVENLTSYRPAPSIVTRRQVNGSPAFTSSTSGNVFFAPGDIAVVYDMKTLTGGGYTGVGQSIAVVGQSSVQVSDIENFQKAAGLTVQDPTELLVPLSGSPVAVAGDQGESDLDLEWSGAIARGATILFVYTGNATNYSVFNSIEYAVDEKLAQIITISYGSCETAFGSPASFETVLAQAASQGQTVLAASGDQGSTACDLPNVYTSLTTAQQQALAVNYPASSAYVTAVGGTEIDPSNTNYSTAGNGYWSTASGTDVITSALQYIPEVAWNDDTTTGCVDANNNPIGCLGAGGGGVSQYVAKPSWQTTLTPADGKRDVPDIALYSSASHPGYLFCTSDQSDWQSGQQGSCTSGFRDSSTSMLTVAGGTSFATPIFAGMLAILNQSTKNDAGQGNINSMLYGLATSGGAYTAANGFHDITSGNNNCNAGTTLCGSTTGFSAGVGYDQVTGLGSVDLGVLASKWSASSSTAVGTVTKLTATVNNPSVNSNDVVTIKVTPDSGTATPTGSVKLDIDGGSGTAGGSSTTLTLGTNGSVQYTANFTTTGSHQIVAQFSDATNIFAPSTGALPLTVMLAPTVTLTTSPTSATTAQSVTVSVTVSGGAGNPTPTGTVTLTSGTYTSAAATLTGGAASIVVPAGSLPVGSDTLTVAYTPDSGSSGTYGVATGTAVEAVTGVSPTVTVTPASSSITAGQPLSVTVTVSGPSGDPTPTGTVTLSSGSYSSAATVLASGAATISIPAGKLAAGSNTLTATYAPDTAGATIYTTATGSSTVSVGTIAPTLSVTPSSSSITTLQALSVSVTVNGGTGNPTPTGTVTLTSGTYTSAAAALASGAATISIPAGKLAAGSDTLNVSYTPDSTSSGTYSSASGSGAVTVTVVKPTVTVTPASLSITTAQSLSVTVMVSGGTGSPTATGTVTLASGTYTSTASTLTSGSATIVVPAGALAGGSDTLTATYTPDAAGSTLYSGSTGLASVTVTNPVLITPSVTITPSSSSISTTQALSVTVGVSGGTGNPTPTGTVTLTSGSYSSAATTLSGGSATISVPAGSLTVGSDILTAAYAPDASSATVYNAATNTSAVTVTASGFTLSGTAVTVTAGTPGTSTITVSSATGYTGTITLSCAVTSTPTNATNLPTCTSGQTVNLSASTTSGTAMVTINSTATTTAQLSLPGTRRNRSPWADAGSGAVLAALVLLWIPAKRRKWLTMLSGVLAFALLSGLIACGGGGSSSSGGGGTTIAGTTPGSYTLTITGTGNDAASTKATTTVQLTVN